jgi:hypothetical protein
VGVSAPRQGAAASSRIATTQAGVCRGTGSLCEVGRCGIMGARRRWAGEGSKKGAVGTVSDRPLMSWNADEGDQYRITSFPPLISIFWIVWAGVMVR